MSYQKLVVVGNLGRDPDQRFMPDGTPTTTFSVATNRKWTNQDGSKGEETVWFKVTTWRKLAEICAQYLTKGRQVLVEGRLTPDKETGAPRVWTGNDGVARSSFEVTAETVKFLGKAEAAEPKQESYDDPVPF